MLNWSGHADKTATELSNSTAGIISTSLGDIIKSLSGRLETSPDMAEHLLDSKAPILLEAGFSVPFTRSTNLDDSVTALSQLLGMWTPGEKYRITELVLLELVEWGKQIISLAIQTLITD